MSRAGDGAPRSEQRRLDGSISFRCMTREKLRYEATARGLGFPSLSAWIVDLMQSQGGVSPRLRRMLSGRLAQVGARLAEMSITEGSDHVGTDLSALVSEITQVQVMLMTGATDDPEVD